MYVCVYIYKYTLISVGLDSVFGLGNQDFVEDGQRIDYVYIYNYIYIVCMWCFSCYLNFMQHFTCNLATWVFVWYEL